MNIEELKMILETINATTGLAKEMGTTWIWLHYGFKVLQGLVVLATVGIVFYAIYKTILTIHSGTIDTQFMRECRDKLKIGSTGVMTDWEYHVTTSEIRELINRHNKNKTAV